MSASFRRLTRGSAREVSRSFPPPSNENFDALKYMSCNYITKMATYERHMSQYQAFRDTANLPGASPPGRVELLFLATYHLIDACAAKRGQHINKHQNVRRELEANPIILGERTSPVWRAFNDLQGDFRSKFVYGGNWTSKDLKEAIRSFETVERLCLEALR